MSTPSDTIDPSKFHLNRSFSLGDIGVCISLLLAGFLSFSSIDKRVTITEGSLARIESDQKSNSLEMKVDLKDTQKQVLELRSDVTRLVYAIERGRPASEQVRK